VVEEQTMAVTSFHAPTNRWLTSSYGWKPGDVVQITYGSYAYDSAPGGFGFRGCETTQYTLAEPVAENRYGEPLFDLDECDPRCPIDNSSQRHDGKRLDGQGAWMRPDGVSAHQWRETQIAA
jgi:hypothetical protein